MNLPQLHYGWAPPGPDGSGLRFTAVTDGVPAALLREAERLVAYEAPEPGGAVPQALSLSLLSDGSRLLARSAYTGGDGTGFHAHAVHLPQRAGSGPVGGALPITSWGSPQWAARTPPGGPPPPLRAVPVPGRHDPAALAEFVAAREAWLAPFFADVRRLVEEPGAPRIVLVEPDSAAVARWVMLACSVLPHQRGQWLTFTTYTARPGLAPQGLVGVLAGEGTAAALAALEEGCRIHEPGRGAAPRAAGDVFDVWAGTAARIWLARRPELFARVRELPGGPYEAGPLAALALGAGIRLDAAGRAAAEAWTAAHPDPSPARLRVALTDPGREPDALAGLLREAARQGTDTTGELPEVARRVAFALFTDPDRAYGEETRAGLDELPVLRALVLDRLDALAAGDPAAGTELFARTGLRLRAAEALPHLRMCAAARAVVREAPDRPVALDALLRVCGVSPYAEPLVLRTAVRLVWGGRRADPDEAGLVLATTGEAVHREAGTWESFAPAGPPAGGRADSGALREAAPGGRPYGAPAGPDRPTPPEGSGARDETRPPLRAGKGPTATPGGEPAPGNGTGTGRTPGAGVGPAPGVGPTPETGTGRTPKAGDGHAPEAGPTPGTRTRTGRTPKAGVEPAPEAGPTPETGTGRTPKAGDGPAPEAGPTPGTRTRTGRTPEAGVGPAPGAGPTPETGTGRTPKAEVGPAPEAGPTPDPGTGPTPGVGIGTGIGPTPGARVRMDGPGSGPAGVAARLLGEERAEGAVRVLFESEDAVLLAAYREAARGEAVRERLRSSPRYLADCFAVWSAHPQAGPLWRQARTDLLEEVLRPLVRELPSEHLAEAERELARLGRSRAEEFRAWLRPGPGARLRGLFGRRPAR
ncbi:GTPase-associated protein 1-related protein [Streptomyces sp. NPDC004667]|uniref:GTPase-associated protein 1-related protein n=1 Tax=Streptomyces sp. NPDC004667 TaxID=3154285 RepID=UPI0033AE222B